MPGIATQLPERHSGLVASWLSQSTMVLRQAAANNAAAERATIAGWRARFQNDIDALPAWLGPDCRVGIGAMRKITRTVA